MKIQLSNEDFLDNLMVKYGFGKDEKGCIDINFTVITDEELVEVLNRFFTDCSVFFSEDKTRIIFHYENDTETSVTIRELREIIDNAFGQIKEEE